MRFTLNRRHRLHICKATALMAACAWGLSGCGGINLGLDALFTDTGTDVVLQAELSDYLDLSALEDTEAADGTWNGYETYTLEYGTFSTETAVNRANIVMLEVSPVKVEYTTGTMRMVEMLVERNDFVHAGDVIARVDMETNALDLEELALRLQRLRERYAEAAAEHQQSQQEAEENFSVYRYLRRIDQLEYEQADRDFARRAASYEEQIADYEEQIAALRGLSATSEIRAPEDGFVLSVNYILAGREIPSGTTLVSMAPADKICLEFGDPLAHYGYGMEMTLAVGNSINPVKYQAYIANISDKQLSSDWSKGYSRVAGDFSVEDLVGQGPFYVYGITNVMENVLLVPADAVRSEKQKYYVTVLHDDNTLETRQFIPGGSNSEYYWVFDGLEEGTRIIITN